MHFGQTNPPVTFQLALDLIITRHKWKTCLVYMDDSIVVSKKLDEHIQRVDEMLTALGEAGVSVILKKCPFSVNTLTT